MTNESPITNMLAEAGRAYEAGNFVAAAQSFRRAAEAARASGNLRQAAVALANLGAAYGQGGDLSASGQALLEARQLNIQMGDLLGECKADISLGTVYGRMERWEDSCLTWQSALDLARRMLNSELAAIATNGLAGAHIKLGQRDEARALYQKLLGFHEKQKNEKEQIETLIELARLELDAGNTAVTEQHGQRALSLARKLGDQMHEAYCLYKLGSVYQHTGFNLQALDLLTRAVASYRAQGKRGELGMALNELAMVHDRLGSYQEALTLYQEALQIAGELGHLTDQGAALHGVGSVYHAVGKLEDAEAYYRRALKLTEDAKDWRSAALTLTNLGVITADMGRQDEALSILQQALFYQKKNGDLYSQGHTLISIATLQQDSGDIPAALNALQEALAIQAQTGDRNSQAVSHHTIGEVLAVQERYIEALEEKEQALRLFRQVSNPVGQIQVLYGIARLHARTGFLPQAVEVLEQAVRQIEGMRMNLISESLRTAYFSHQQNIYALYVEVLLAMQRKADAFRMVERSKARTFLDLLSEAQSAFQAEMDPALREQESSLLAEMDGLQRQINALPEGESGQTAARRDQLQELERQYQIVQGEIRKQNPHYSALTQPALWGIAEVQRDLLDEHTALLEYILGEGASTLFVVLKDDFQIFHLPPRAQIETRVRELRASLTLHRYLHGDDLYQDLIAPAESMVRGKDLLIVADGVLHYLPFALLLTRPPEAGAGAPGGLPGVLRSAQAFSEDQLLTDRLAAQLDPLPPFDFPSLPYLVKEHALHYVPSASAACLMKSEARGRRSAGAGEVQIAALGDPLVPGASELPAAAVRSLRAGLERLPCTADEVWRLAGLFEKNLPAAHAAEYASPRVLLYTAEKASKTQMLALTDGSRAYRFLHLATHGLLNLENPQFSGLLFSPLGGGSAYWQTFEIFQAHIPAETVVLSACETGLGKIIRGEGLVGLARAFLYAGAQRVCVSLWKVADISTPGLMEQFYAGMLAGAIPAQALRQAQLALVAEGTYSHPYFWAPFVVVGTA